MKIITAPEFYYHGIHRKDITCFLAGGITNCPGWQNDVIDYLKEHEEECSDLVILNPRRKDFSIQDTSATIAQIIWESHNLQLCDIFSMYFANTEKSDQPICFYELGRNVTRLVYEKGTEAKSHMVISYDENFRRKQDVMMQTTLATGGTIIVHETKTPQEHARYIIDAYEKLKQEKQE